MAGPSKHVRLPLARGLEDAKRVQRSSQKHAASKPQASSASQTQTWPAISFLFNVNTLPLNEEPSNGGVPPRTDDNGRWLPPMYGAGFRPQTLGILYKWQNGVITPATGYTWHNQSWWSSQHGVPNIYRTSTMFYCNPFDHFLSTEGDASTRDMANSPAPNNRWYTLNFQHDYTLSRLDLGGDRPYLAGNGRRFIDELGIASWRHPDEADDPAPTSSGLAGNLALLIGLVVFSCRAERMDTVLRNAWRSYQWIGHNHSNGRT